MCSPRSIRRRCRRRSTRPLRKRARTRRNSSTPRRIWCDLAPWCARTPRPCKTWTRSRPRSISTRRSIDADQAAIEAAQTQLNYATIIAPIDGVVGFRQVDIGNIIHTTDTNPLTVLTQIKPCVAIFTLPQDDLGPVREAMLQGAVEVLAFDQDNVKQLAQGKLLLIDNQIDQTHQHDPAKGRIPEPSTSGCGPGSSCTSAC